MRSGLLRTLLRLGAGVVIAFGAAGLEPVVTEREAAAETTSFLDGIVVGAELMATDDIRLARADIAKGAKVSITKLLVRQGQIASVELALADGHVVKKVALATIRDFFRIVSEKR
jgi:hypothetical protein